MKKLVVFILFAAILNVLLWYLCEGLLWLQFLSKPYTPLGMTFKIWAEHLTCVFLALGIAYVACTTVVPTSKRR